MQHKLQPRPSTVVYAVSYLVEACGGTKATAALFGVAPPTVSNWLRNGKLPPARYLDMQAKAKRRGLILAEEIFGETPDARHAADG